MAGTYKPQDSIPLPPPDAKKYTTACDYCIVGCGYRVFVWPEGQEGGQQAGQNALGKDMPVSTGGGWFSPNQHNMVMVDGKRHHVVVQPDPDATVVNRGGNHSIRGGNLAGKVYNPDGPTADRLKTPLRRVGGKGIGREAFEPIGWDEALDEVAARLAGIAEEFGPEAVWPYFYAGTMGLVQRDGIERFRHVLKYSRQHSTICSSLADSGWLAGVGVKYGPDSREMADSDLIIAWGGNPVSTQVNVMHHISQARKRRRAKFAVVDPYRTGSAAQADIHLMPRPGTDGALGHGRRLRFRPGWCRRRS